MFAWCPTRKTLIRELASQALATWQAPTTMGRGRLLFQQLNDVNVETCQSSPAKLTGIWEQIPFSRGRTVALNKPIDKLTVKAQARTGIPHDLKHLVIDGGIPGLHGKADANVHVARDAAFMSPGFCCGKAPRSPIQSPEGDTASTDGTCVCIFDPGGARHAQLFVEALRGKLATQRAEELDSIDRWCMKIQDCQELDQDLQPSYIADNLGAQIRDVEDFAFDAVASWTSGALWT